MKLLDKITEDQNLDRVLDKRAVADFIGVSTPTLDRMVRRGHFPKPIQLSLKKLGWQLRAVMAWLDTKALESAAA